MKSNDIGCLGWPHAKQTLTPLTNASASTSLSEPCRRMSSIHIIYCASRVWKSLGLCSGEVEGNSLRFLLPKEQRHLFHVGECQGRRSLSASLKQQHSLLILLFRAAAAHSGRRTSPTGIGREINRSHLVVPGDSAGWQRAGIMEQFSSSRSQRQAPKSPKTNCQGPLLALH